MTVSWARLCAILVCSASFAGGAVAQQPRATISGRVAEGGTQTPLSDASVVIVGTQRGARTDARGQYRIGDLAPGAYTLRVTRLGYSAATRALSITGTEAATADFTLQSAAVQIDEVLVTATGATERKRENGNDVGIIKPGDKVDLAATPTLTQALQGQEAGLTITSGSGTAGASSRIRIRGANSISLSNDPLIIVDGVRVDNNTSGSASLVGGQVISRFDDINPEEVESIEVLKGPAASALYGTAAANGVLQITTKRGHAGRTSWRAYADYGRMWDPTQYPDNYYVFGTNSTTHAVYNGSCTLDARSRSLCTADSSFTFNPLQHYNVLGTGNQVDYGLSAAGGADVAQYYVSGDIQRAQGIVDPNKTHNVSLRANINAQLRSNLTATFTANYIDRHVALPINDNNIYGVVPNGILGHAFDCSAGATGGAKTFCGADTVSRGFYSRVPSTFYFQTNQQTINRFIGGTNVTWQPLSWLTALVVGGLDIDNSDEASITPSNVVTDINSTLAQGSVTEYRRQVPDYSVSATLTAKHAFTSTLFSNTSVGSQYVNEQSHYEYGFGRNLVPGTLSLAGATAGASVSDNNQTVITLGEYGSEQLAWRDRLFLTGGVRADRNSAFGTQVSWAYYPSASLSWVVSDESFMRDHVPSWVDQVRLRTAYGQSGQRPAFRQAETYLNSSSVASGSTEVPAVVIGGTGNQDLKPEISIEDEAGFDASFFGNRLGLEYTHYHKITRDALVAAVLAPSLGVSASQYVNLGRNLNSGNELTLRWKAFDFARGPALDFTFAGSTNSNKLLSLGQDATGKDLPSIIFNPQRFAKGYSLGGYFQQKYNYNDANGDGIISRSEVTLNPDTSTAAEYLGSVLPTRTLSVTPNLTYKSIHLSALVDARGGNKLFNYTEAFRCTTSAFQNCKAVSDPSSSLSEQARAIAYQTYATYAGYIEPAGFTKLRVVSLGLNLPSALLQHSGFSAGTVTLSGHNLKTWTNYSGYDPELNGLQSNFTTQDFLTQPPVRTWTVRLDFNF
ncbi:MAG TPA: SusC/RagA family TonB-linked outer membrane protein [Gemmatimonadaceae bacterium]|jgi:TonB-linked SusC/RagA family outer membrane protein